MDSNKNNLLIYRRKIDINSAEMLYKTLTYCKVCEKTTCFAHSDKTKQCLSCNNIFNKGNNDK